MKENKETLFWHFKDQALGERGVVWAFGGEVEVAKGREPLHLHLVS